MHISISDLPLEVFELTLIFGLGLGQYLQNRALKREKGAAEIKLSDANDELKHLRRMLDRILMVEKGYERPSADFGEKVPVARHTPTRLF